MGYAGGHQANPDYQHIGDHTETVQVDYDPQRITYVQLLDIFWQNHQPTRSPGPRQYRKAVFFHDESQRRLAMESRSALEKHLGQTVRTDVVTLRSFTMAEEYHQKYLLKQKYGLNAEMSRIYPDPKEFIDSTAVARVNGYSGGNGSKEQFFRDIDRLGLSETGKQELREIMQRQWKYEEKY